MGWQDARQPGIPQLTAFCGRPSRFRIRHLNGNSRPPDPWQRPAKAQVGEASSAIENGNLQLARRPLPPSATKSIALPTTGRGCNGHQEPRDRIGNPSKDDHAS